MTHPDFDASVYAWQLRDEVPFAKQLYTIDCAEGPSLSMAWSKDGRYFGLTANDSRRFGVMRGADGAVVRFFDVPNVSTVCFDPLTGRVMSLKRDGSPLAAWELVDGSLQASYRNIVGGHWAPFSLLEPESDMAWSPDGAYLALTNLGTLSVRQRSALDGEGWLAHGVGDIIAWKGDCARLAVGSKQSVSVWNVATWERTNLDACGPVAWHPRRPFLAAAIDESHIGIWDERSWRLLHRLEGHTGALVSLAFSESGNFLVSDARDGVVRVWRTRDWEPVAMMRRTARYFASKHGASSFNPSTSRIAIADPADDSIRVWRLDFACLEDARSVLSSARYTNAKIVLVGDTGVGKSALAHAILGHGFVSTDSTHGRAVWTLERREVPVEHAGVPAATSEMRETLLWDLAGQTGYRLLHRQHLDDVAVALVLFDSRSETEPFAGVHFWARAIDDATKTQPATKFLIASRADRFGPSVSSDRIDEVREQLGFAGFFETSAASGKGVAELLAVVRDAIEWSKLPSISTPDLFYDVKAFIVHRRNAGGVLQTRSELVSAYRAARTGAVEEAEMARCLRSLASAGLIKSLSFGSLVLLQPELIDQYLGWLASAARRQPDGLGFIAVEDARRGRFEMDGSRLLRGSGDEQLLTVATVEEVIGRGLAIVQSTDSGEMLVFPSELRAEGLESFPGGLVRAVQFALEGPIKGIYATLAVRLTHTPSFTAIRYFRNAAVFEAVAKETCAFSMRYPDAYDDSRGEITVYFGQQVSRHTKLTFLRYINRQLETMAFRGTLERLRVYECPLGHKIPGDAVEWRKSNDYSSALCGYCGREVPIDDLAERAIETDLGVDDQIEKSSAQQERQTRLAVLGERESRQEYHVFLCHSSTDKPEVRRIDSMLRREGFLPWFDEQGLIAGQFVPELERAIDNVPVACVIVGPSSMGPWQRQEYYAFMERYVRQRNAVNGKPLAVIPVILPSVRGQLELPPFLRAFTRADFRVDGGLDNSEVISRLVRMVTAGIAGDSS
jgi:small GTP-binding protein